MNNDALIQAGNALAFAAQITGGVAGRDDGLMDAIERWTKARDDALAQIESAQADTPRAEVRGEPVAWMNEDKKVISLNTKKDMTTGPVGNLGPEFALAARMAERYNIPLYAHPPRAEVQPNEWRNGWLPIELLRSVIDEMGAGQYMTREEKDTTDYEVLIDAWRQDLCKVSKAYQHPPRTVSVDALRALAAKWEREDTTPSDVSREARKGYVQACVQHSDELAALIAALTPEPTA